MVGSAGVSMGASRARALAGSFAARFAACFSFALPASSTTLVSSSHASCAVCHCSRSVDSSRCKGFNTSPSAGDFITPGRPTISPHKLGTTRQSSCCLGATTARAPIRLDSAVIAPTAVKSGGHCMRSAMSMTQPRRASGNSSGSNWATGGRALGSGAGSGQALAPTPSRSVSSAGKTGISVVTNLDTSLLVTGVAPSMQARTASNPARWCRSLKSVSLSPRSPEMLGFVRFPPTAFAASVALVIPGLPGVFQSSSAARIRRSSGYLLCSAWATSSRLPAFIAHATAWPVASWIEAPVAKPSHTISVPWGLPMAK